MTVRDAIRMIHAIGLRYAWVDTLCIVQDDPKGVTLCTRCTLMRFSHYALALHDKLQKT
jgi:hypothetical protein